MASPIIHSIHIEKFRAFKNVQFEFSSNVVAIAGQNGTMKTTLLGMLAQPFSLKSEGPLKGMRTLDGKEFGSRMESSFRFSRELDPPGDHIFTLYVSEDICGRTYFKCASIPAAKNKNGKSDRKEHLRFWNVEGHKKAGSGYMQLPVLFLSMKRLLPIGETSAKVASMLPLQDHEIKEFKKRHNEILTLLEEITSLDHISGKGKSTLAVNTEKYRSLAVSAGQDNIGKILMSVLSFARLKKEKEIDYKGGILCIDEIESTLFPSAQVKLLHFLNHAASKYNLQIFFTTHSLTILNEMLNHAPQKDCLGQVLFLQNLNSEISSCNWTSEQIMANLNIVPIKATSCQQKVRLYTEDPEALLFTKYLLKKYSKYIDYQKSSAGCTQYLEFIKNDCPEFLNNLVILDSDAIQQRKPATQRAFNSVILLPADEKSPETLFYDFLRALPPNDSFWSQEYSQQMCFKDYLEMPKEKARTKYKDWFKSQKEFWGRGGCRLFGHWEISSSNNKKEADKFREEFCRRYQQLTGKILE